MKGRSDSGQSGSSAQKVTNAKNRKKGKGFNKNKSEIRKCFHCNKPGHLKKNCYDWIRKQKHVNTKSNLASNSGSINETEVLTISKTDQVHEWVLDSGCSFHMSPNKEWFQNFETDEHETINMGNNNACRV